MKLRVAEIAAASCWYSLSLLWLAAVAAGGLGAGMSVPGAANPLVRFPFGAWLDLLQLYGDVLVWTASGSFLAITILLVLSTGLWLRRDFLRECSSSKYIGFARYQEFDAARYPIAAEFALWTLLLFPIYPWLRCLGRRYAANHVMLMLASAAILAGGSWAAWHFDQLALPAEFLGQNAPPIYLWLEGCLILLNAAWVLLCGRRFAGHMSRSLGLLAIRHCRPIQAFDFGSAVARGKCWHVDEPTKFPATARFPRTPAALSIKPVRRRRGIHWAVFLLAVLLAMALSSAGTLLLARCAGIVVWPQTAKDVR